MRISWACNNCVKTQMSILYGWLEKQPKEPVNKKPAKSKTTKKRNAKKQIKK